MILNITHKGVRQCYENGSRRWLPPEHADKIERILARLDQATAPGDMDLPGFRLHPLKGDRKGYWSVSVSGNLRIVFRFEGSDVAGLTWLTTTSSRSAIRNIQECKSHSICL